MSDGKKVLGIVGGMGPGATALLFQKIITYTDARCDAEHIHILIDNYPQIPDRTQAILAGSTAPAEYICQSGERLCRVGAELLAIPCNTSHYYYSLIRERMPVPVIHMIEETAAVCAASGYRTVGVLATTGTCSTGVFDTALQAVDIATVYPSADGQRAVMSVIYDQVKAGRPIDTAPLKPFLDEMARRGAEAFILGCTELPLALRGGDYGYTYIDTLDVLAKSAIVRAGYRVKE